MTTATLCKKLLGVKDTVVESYDFYTDSDGVNHFRIYARANVWHQDVCPHCGRRHLPRYDRAARNPKVWRGLDFGGALSLRSCLKLTVSSVRITVWLPLLFHGPILPAALRRNSI